MRSDSGVVRRAALLLSSDRPLREGMDELSEMLAGVFEAPIVLLGLVDPEGTVSVQYLRGGDQMSGSDHCTSMLPADIHGLLERERSARYDYASEWQVPQAPHGSGHSIASNAAIFVPVTFMGKKFGILSVQSRAAAAYSDQDVELISACATYIGARLSAEEHRRDAARYESLATLDPLTGIPNRGAFEVMLNQEWELARLSGSPMSLLMIDVDLFKAYNDTYGHAAGDNCLRQLVAAFSDCLKSLRHRMARYGGEEFAVLLKCAGLAEAIELAEVICFSVEQLNIKHGATSLGRVSISLGAASMTPKGDDGAIELVKAADTALYEAKYRGRNRVSAAGYLSTRLPAYTSAPARGNIPSPRTRFIGRLEDCQALSARVRRDRMVTVVGPGGIGKTRLALEVARQLATEVRDGAWFVDLSGTSDETALASLIASITKDLTVAKPGGVGLMSALGALDALLVLDNCEHVLENVAEVVHQILASAPGIRILATSRVPLAVDAESIYRISTLDLQDGVALFADRAKSAGIDEAALAEMDFRELVLALDSLPLAIELAAPRLTTLSIEQLQTGFEGSLSFLRSAGRATPSRQQTLEALIDWSFRLLGSDEKIVLRRLSVFVGGFTRDCGIDVCVDGRLPADVVGGLLDELVDKSLVQRDLVEGTTRYRLLEATRAFALKALRASNDLADTTLRYANVFRMFARACAARRESQTSSLWLRQVSLERGNIEATLSALFDARRFDEAGEMLIDLRDWVWLNTSELIGILARLEDALQLEAEVSMTARTAFAFTIAQLTCRRDMNRALQHAERARDYYSRVDRADLVAATLRVILTAHLMLGTIPRSLADDLVPLAHKMQSEGKLLEAATLLTTLGVVYTQNVEQADLRKAIVAFEDASALLERRGDFETCLTLRGNCADLMFHLGDRAGAVRLVRELLSTLAEADDPLHRFRAAFQYMNLGHFTAWEGDYSASREALRKAHGAIRISEPYVLASLVDKFARLAHEIGQLERSALLLGFADATLEKEGATRQRLEAPLVESLRNSLQERLSWAFEIAHGRGRSCDREVIESEMFLV